MNLSFLMCKMEALKAAIPRINVRNKAANLSKVLKINHTGKSQ